MTFTRGFTNENADIRCKSGPGPLRDMSRFAFWDCAILRKPLALKGDPLHLGSEIQVGKWSMFPPSTPNGQAEYARALVQTVRSITKSSDDGVFYRAATWIPASEWGTPGWLAYWKGNRSSIGTAMHLPAMTAFG